MRGINSPLDTEIVPVIMSKELCQKFNEISSLVCDCTIHIAWLLSLQTGIAEFPVKLKTESEGVLFLLSLTFVDCSCPVRVAGFNCSWKALSSCVLCS